MERFKYIIYAIFIGLFWDGFVVLLQYLNVWDAVWGVILSILVLTVVANLLVYKVFVIKNKKAYALVCIPSAYAGLYLFFNVWEMLTGEVTKYGINTVVLWYYSIFSSICVFWGVIFIRKLITKRKFRILSDMQCDDEKKVFDK